MKILNKLLLCLGFSFCFELHAENNLVEIVSNTHFAVNGCEQQQDLAFNSDNRTVVWTAYDSCSGETKEIVSFAPAAVDTLIYFSFKYINVPQYSEFADEEVFNWADEVTLNASAYSPLTGEKVNNLILNHESGQTMTLNQFELAEIYKRLVVKA